MLEVQVGVWGRRLRLPLVVAHADRNAKRVDRNAPRVRSRNAARPARLLYRPGVAHREDGERLRPELLRDLLHRRPDVALSVDCHARMLQKACALWAARAAMIDDQLQRR